MNIIVQHGRTRVKLERKSTENKKEIILSENDEDNLDVGLGWVSTSGKVQGYEAAGVTVVKHKIPKQ